jgi:hypothetical protein
MDYLPSDQGQRFLCDLLLQVAGRDATRLISVRRHAQVLNEALPFMSEPQAKVAQARIASFETKWGSLLSRSREEPENGEIPPEQRVARWLSRRRNSKHLLEVIYEAAVCIANGETRLLDVRDYAYRQQIDRMVQFVGYDSFKEWLTQLRVGTFKGDGRVQPGALCPWWVDNMNPADPNEAAYAACMRRQVL